VTRSGEFSAIGRLCWDEFWVISWQTHLVTLLGSLFCEEIASQHQSPFTTAEPERLLTSGLSNDLYLATHTCLVAAIMPKLHMYIPKISGTLHSIINDTPGSVMRCSHEYSFNFAPRDELWPSWVKLDPEEEVGPRGEVVHQVETLSSGGETLCSPLRFSSKQ
jgi:hypothetical protein